MVDPEKSCLDHNVQWQIFQHRFLKPYILASHRMHGNKNTPPFINLIASATYDLSFLSFFSNCDETTMDYIMVFYEATNLVDGTWTQDQGMILLQKLHNIQWLVQKRKDILNLKEFLQLEKHQEEGTNLFKDIWIKVKPSLMKR